MEDESGRQLTGYLVNTVTLTSSTTINGAIDLPRPLSVPGSGVSGEGVVHNLVEDILASL